MRVPIPVALLLVLLVVGGTWWINTRKLDFTTPPSTAQLAKVRMEVESSFSQKSQSDDAISASTPATRVKQDPPILEEPKLDLGDLKSPPRLDSYRDRAPAGAGHLIALATRLEQVGEFQRALLAWERVLDHAKPDQEQQRSAVSAISRLRPTLPDWNNDPTAAIAITLHAGTDPTLAKPLSLALEEVASELERASSGILKVTAQVTAGKVKTPPNEPKPSALWLTGPGKDASSTEVLSFTTEAPENLRDHALKTVFALTRNHLAALAHLTPPPDGMNDANPKDALHFQITRLCWSELARSLNPAPKTSE